MGDTGAIMVIIKNENPNDFKKYVKNKALFLFGAGRTAKHCIDVYCENKKIEAVIDNGTTEKGSCITYPDKVIPVIDVSVFLEKIKRLKGTDITILITPVFYAWEIIEQLDKIPELNEVTCYLHFLLRNYPLPSDSFEFSHGKNKIPRKLHYFWLGKNGMPEHLQKYVNEWKNKCEDFEIICWNEDNYDVSKNRYMKEAYDSKAWGFVPDYARLDIIYEHGGIYLDTDVEILKSLDVLLQDDAFFCAGSNDQINLGSGFGAVKAHPLIKKLRDYYEDKSFYHPNGEINKLPCYNYQHPVLKEFGFKVENTYQKLNDVVLYPAEVLSPTGIGGLGDFFSEKTLSIHHTELSWISDREKRALEKMKIALKNRLAAEKVNESGRGV